MQDLEKTENLNEQYETIKKLHDFHQVISLSKGVDQKLKNFHKGFVQEQKELFNELDQTNIKRIIAIEKIQLFLSKSYEKYSQLLKLIFVKEKIDNHLQICE